jgi:peroxiredoxin
MSDISPLFPRQPVPSLTIKLAGGGSFELAAERPERFTLVVFYRGLHCPICKAQLKDLEARLPEFETRGVGVVAVSCDIQERAETARADWGLANLRLGHDLNLRDARRWGLYISTGRGKTSIGIEEPALFSEPAIYLIQPDGTLYFGSVQTMPFARPHFADILSAIDVVVAKSYPARGEVTELARAAA